MKPLHIVVFVLLLAYGAIWVRENIKNSDEAARNEQKGYRP